MWATLNYNAITQNWKNSKIFKFINSLQYHLKIIVCLSVWHKLLNIHVHHHLQSLDQRIRDCGIRALSPSDALDDTRAYNAMSKAMQLLKSRLVCTCRNSYSLSSTKVIMTPHTQKYTIVAILINHNCRNTSIPNVVKIHNRCSSNHNLQSWSTTIAVIRLL